MARQLEESFEVVDGEGKRYTIHCWREADASRAFRETMKQWMSGLPVYATDRGEHVKPVSGDADRFHLGEQAIPVTRVARI